MDTGVLIAILVVLVVVAVAAVLLTRRQRTDRLRQRFGPEYERTVSRAGDRRTAEADLSARTQRRQELTIVPLDPAAQARYEQEWRATQGRFVDDPAGATREADTLVTRLMRERGYPVDDDFERQAAVVSVDHPSGRRGLPRRSRGVPREREGAGQHRRLCGRPSCTTGRCSPSC